MSPLKDVAPANIRLMSVARDTSHSLIGPSEPLKQSPVGDASRHAKTAPTRSALDCSENASGGVQSIRDESKILEKLIRKHDSVSVKGTI